MPTLRQQRLAEAVLDPKITTITAAAAKVGMSRVNASRSLSKGNASVALKQNVTVQQEISRLRHNRADKARVILESGLDQMQERMRNAPDASVAGFTKVAADVLSSGLTENRTGPLPGEQDWYSRRFRRWMRRYATWMVQAKVRELEAAATSEITIPDIATR